MLDRDVDENGGLVFTHARKNRVDRANLASLVKAENSAAKVSIERTARRMRGAFTTGV
jgi:hypothetical protein